MTALDEMPHTTIASEPPSEDTKHWYFTFGVGHKLISVLEDTPGVADWTQEGISLAYFFVHATGTHNEARAKMMKRFGNAWAFQYDGARFDEINRESKYRRLADLR